LQSKRLRDVVAAQQEYHLNYAYVPAQSQNHDIIAARR